MITPGFSSSLPCFYLRFSVLSFISVSSFWLFPVSKRVSVKPTQLGLLFCFVFICAHGHVKSRCATATGDFHFRTYIFRCILRSISGTLQVHIRNASSIRFRSASGTLWENDPGTVSRTTSGSMHVGYAGLSHALNRLDFPKDDPCDSCDPLHHFAHPRHF